MKKIKINQIQQTSVFSDSDSVLLHNTSQGLSRVDKQAFNELAFQNKKCGFISNVGAEEKYITTAPEKSKAVTIFITIKAVLLAYHTSEEIALAITLNHNTLRHSLIRRDGNSRLLDFKYGVINNKIAFSIISKVNYLHYLINADICDVRSFHSNPLEFNNDIDSTAFQAVVIQ